MSDSSQESGEVFVEGGDQKMGDGDAMAFRIQYPKASDPHVLRKELIDFTDSDQERGILLESVVDELKSYLKENHPWAYVRPL
jgi:hypothetical protein